MFFLPRIFCKICCGSTRLNYWRDCTLLIHFFKTCHKFDSPDKWPAQKRMNWMSFEESKVNRGNMEIIILFHITLYRVYRFILMPSYISKGYCYLQYYFFLGPPSTLFFITRRAITTDSYLWRQGWWPTLAWSLVSWTAVPPWAQNHKYHTHKNITHVTILPLFSCRFDCCTS